MAGDLTLSGHKVKLYAVKDHSLNLSLIQSIGKITIEGVTTKYKTPIDVDADFVEKDFKTAILNSEVIFINVPAFAQNVYINLIIKYGQKGQIIVFPCGAFSAINFYNKLCELGIEEKFIVTETASFIYTTKIIGPAKVLIKSIKDNVNFSAYPNKNSDFAIEKINKIYPQFRKAQNAWQTSFDNPS